MSFVIAAVAIGATAGIAKIGVGISKRNKSDNELIKVLSNIQSSLFNR